ncbi:MAG TPA: cobyric acid synthase [Actinomycetes bacterium]|nr:cobyric acid synthase [Actinomycetes bacterium]
MNGSLLVTGTHSDAGKTVVVAGLCRWLRRQGVAVAPFKAQNMALNSMVTPDGAEIGRAQAVQAAAAGIEPTALMNPVLLKPGSDTHSQVIVLGQPWREADALGYQPLKAQLREVVLDSLVTLRSRYEVVICEGAGSPAEVNLRRDDLANMGLARAAGLPVLLVGDIDRGGVFASLFGTLALLDAADQRHVAGFVINKFRGDQRLLAPGLEQLSALTGRPFLGVLGWRAGLWLDAEDSLDLEGERWTAGDPLGDVLRVSVVRLPRMSNYTDVDALASEPGVLVRLASRAEELADADLVVLPGTRATVRDLDWLRDRGLAEALARRAAAERPILGICGGYQMLGRAIADEVESGRGSVQGLGLLPVSTTFAAAKTLSRPHGTAAGFPVAGYEIHHGRTAVEGGEPLLVDEVGAGEGCVAGAVAGTSWHGLFESDEFRRAYLAEVAARVGRDWRPGTVAFAEVRAARLDALGDLVAEGMDTAAVLRLLAGGVPEGLPFVPPGVPAPAAAMAGPP